MKKIIFMAMLLPAMLFAQEEKAAEKPNLKKYTVSANLNLSDPSQLGGSIESFSFKEGDKFNGSFVLNVSSTGMRLEKFGGKMDGSGFGIELGNRDYYGKTSHLGKGLYSENLLAYGSVNFEQDMIPGVQDGFDAKYSYFSLINPSIGYKWEIGRFSIDPSAGFNWKWEFKNDGFENRDIDNFVFKFGLKAGFTF